jgi:hypothetical protein
MFLEIETRLNVIAFNKNTRPCSLMTSKNNWLSSFMAISRYVRLGQKLWSFYYCIIIPHACLANPVGLRRSWSWYIFNFQKAVLLWMKSPVERDVTTLRQALTGPIIDIKTATEIICTRISSQIRQIKQVYTPTFGTLLEYDIGYHTSGDHRKVPPSNSTA